MKRVAVRSLKASPKKRGKGSGKGHAKPKPKTKSATKAAARPTRGVADREGPASLPAVVVKKEERDGASVATTPPAKRVRFNSFTAHSVVSGGSGGTDKKMSPQDSAKKWREAIELETALAGETSLGQELYQSRRALRNLGPQVSSEGVMLQARINQGMAAVELHKSILRLSAPKRKEHISVLLDATPPVVWPGKMQGYLLAARIRDVVQACKEKERRDRENQLEGASLICVGSVGCGPVTPSCP